MNLIWKYFLLLVLFNSIFFVRLEARLWNGSGFGFVKLSCFGWEFVLGFVRDLIWQPESFVESDKPKVWNLSPTLISWVMLCLGC